MKAFVTVKIEATIEVEVDVDEDQDAGFAASHLVETTINTLCSEEHVEYLEVDPIDVVIPDGPRSGLLPPWERD